MQTTNERCLSFKIPKNENTNIRAEKIAEVLKDNNIDFVCYDKDTSYYPCQFVIRRSGKKWEEIMLLINPVYAPKYDFKKSDFYLIGQRDGYNGILGNMQEVAYCN